MALPTVDIHGKAYVMVKDRIMEFHNRYKFGSIVTEITLAGDSVLAKATVQTNDTPQQTFTGHSEAIRRSNGITGQSPVEVAETSAVGRALGMLGIGILESVASADEILKAPTEKPSLNPHSPQCAHGAAKRIQVKKEGPNKGRYFYACGQPKEQQCDMFVWEDEYEAAHAVVSLDEEAPVSEKDLPF